MHRLTGSPRDYEWGSHSTIQEFLGTTTPGPIAELWFG
ncbi:MAG: hypothetical protein JWP95_1446, partial [Actinotalea sp.]|nr:hypothetical protein [Actinotalea sp.]